ncbi:MAG: hypothetical protein INR71_11955, partial [Terriglobus roseus]|nr:hypothetical protein [Terriglobus roseus]
MQTSTDSQASEASASETASVPKRPRPIISTEPPKTPPSRGGGLPATFVTPPTPTDARPSTSSQQSTPKAGQKAPPLPGLTSRRSRTASSPPTKLSALSSLTPTVEETKTPGGTLTSPTTAGFFSSVFSATQNAANTLTSSIVNPSFFTGSQRSRSGTGPDQTEKTGPAGGEEVITPDGVTKSSEHLLEDAPQEKKKLAIETLGSGNLSLSHLGISESPLQIQSAKLPMAERTSNGSIVHTEEVMASKEDDAAAKA